MDTETFSYELKIPRDRIAVLIGPKGETKRELESLTNSSFTIDSNEGDVTLSGKDSLGLYLAKDIVGAIGRGFNPDVAKLLAKQDYSIEIIQINEFAKTKNDMMRLRGRLIGEEGKSRRVIEELTETQICVYGKTASVIGRLEWADLARKALEALLSGGNHAGVFRMLEKQRKTLKGRELTADDFEQYVKKKEDVKPDGADSPGTE